jgi:putative nucleotidyltransferase with HDIG domain
MPAALKGDLSSLQLASQPGIEALVRAFEERGGGVGLFHTWRVQYYATALARALGIRSVAFRERLRAAALVHDLGKLAIPDHIVRKPGVLTTRERETMRAHAELGARLLSALDVDEGIIEFVRHHHEAWNGEGYPAGLEGTAIPMGARVLAVVDCFDALTSNRPYRRPMTAKQALAIIRSRAGSMYDPAVVTAFIKVYPSLAPAHSTEVEDRRLGQTAS